MSKIRLKIIKAFSEWTALSSTRSGCPVKSRKDVYPFIRVPDYDFIILKDKISNIEFDSWHKKNTF